MPRIKIKDLPKDTKVSKSEMANVRGGFVLPEEWGLVATGDRSLFFAEEPQPGPDPYPRIALDYTGPGGMVASEGGRRGVSPIPVPLP